MLAKEEQGLGSYNAAGFLSRSIGFGFCFDSKCSGVPKTQATADSNSLSNQNIVKHE